MKIIFRLNSNYFRNFIFGRNQKNDNQTDFGFLQIHHIYDFRDFSENGHFDDAYFGAHFGVQFSKCIKGEFVKIREFTIIIIFVIFPQKLQ